MNELQLAFLDPFTWAAIITGGVQLFTGWMGSRAASRSDERAYEYDRETHSELLALERERMAHEREMAGSGLGLAKARLALDTELGRGRLQLARNQFGFTAAETEAGHRRMRPYRELGYRGLKNLEALTTPGVEHTGAGAGPFGVPNPRGSTYADAPYAAEPFLPPADEGRR